jgi:predicted O-methyltransferase YrrM
VEPDAFLLKDTRGFLQEEEGRALYRLAREASRLGPCLEVGSYCGKSALWLGAACRAEGGVLFSVDHHRGSEEQQPGQPYFDAALFDPQKKRVDTLPAFRQTLERAGLEDTVVPVVCPSTLAARAWRTPLGMVFIDGGHAFETVREDYRCWRAHLIPGGYLLFHDVFLDPASGGQAPRRVFEAAAASGRYHRLPMVGTLGILRRKDPVSPGGPADDQALSASRSR